MSQFIDGKKYISGIDAGQQFGYTSDYISKLAREGKIQGKKIGNAWFVEEQSLSSFIALTKRHEEERREQLKQQRKEEYHNGASPSIQIEVEATHQESPYTDHLTFGTQVARLFTLFAGVFIFVVTFTATSGVMAWQPIEKVTYFIERELENRTIITFNNEEFIKRENIINANKDFDITRQSLSASAIHVDVEGIITDSSSYNNETEFLFNNFNGFYDRFTEALALIFVERTAITEELQIDSVAMVHSAQESFLNIGIFLHTFSHDLFVRYLNTLASLVSFTSLTPIDTSATVATINEFLAEGGYVFTTVDVQSEKVAKRLASVASALYRYSTDAALANTFLIYDSLSTQVKTTTQPFFDSSFWFGALDPFFSGNNSPSPQEDSVTVIETPQEDNNQQPSVTTIIREPTTVVQNVTEAITYTGVSPNDFEIRLQQLENKLSSQLYEFTARYEGRTTANFRSIANSQRINNLENVTITNPTIIGGSISGTSGVSSASALNDLTDVTAASPVFGNLIYYDGSGWTTIATSSLGISSGSSFGQGFSLTTNVFSESALTPTTTQNIAINGTGTSTFAGGLEAWRQIAAPYFNATSTTATSTFAGNLSVANLAVTGLTNCDTIDTDANGYLTCGADATGAGGGIATIKESNVQVGDTDITILDFGAGFDLTESPDTEINVALDLSEYNGAASTTLISSSYASSTEAFFGSLSVGNLTGPLQAINGTVSATSSISTSFIENLSGSNTGDVTLAGALDYITLVGQTITRNAIDLAADVTGILSVAFGGTGWGEIQANSILLGNGTSQLATTSAGTNGQVLALVSGVPTWTATTTAGTGLTYTGTAFNVDLGTDIDLTSEVTGILPVANGGTGASSLNDLITLSTHTTGNYLATLSGTTNQITVSGSGSEGATPTLSIPSLFDIQQASTTQFSALTAYFGATATSTFASDGSLSIPSGSTITIGGDSIDEFVGTGLQVSSGDLQTTLGTSVDLTSEVTGVLPDANVANDITLTNITQITNRAISDTTGTLAATRGGTGLSTIASSSLLIGGAGNTWLQFATSSLGIALSDTTGTLGETRGGTGQTTYSTGDILYASGANTLTKLSAGTDGQVLKLSSGVPSWGADNTGGAGGSGVWATTTNDLAIYPSDTSDVVIIGGSATTTTGNIFEVIGSALFDGGTLRVDATNNRVGIGTTSPYAPLSVVGEIVGAFLTATTTSTSTLPELDVTNLQIAGAIEIGSDYINEFAGTGLTVTGNALAADLGTSVDLTSEVTGILPVANGGTGASSLNDLITLGTHTTGNYLATLASSGSITVGGSGSESAAATVNLNLANANDWTALQTFQNASSSLLSAYTAYFGSTATSSFSSAGVLNLAGLSNSGLGVDASGNVYAAATTTAGTGLTYSGGAFNVDLGTSIDISAESNLAVGNGITLTDDTLTVTAAGGLAQTTGGLTTTGVLEDLNTLGAVASDGQFIVGTGAGAFAYESGATARTSLGLGSLATLSSIDISDNTNLAATWPITLTGDTVGWGGIATSSNLSTSQVLYATGVNTFEGVATTSLTAGSGISFTGTPGALLGGSNLTVALDATGDWTGTLDGFEGSTLLEFTYGTNTFSQASLAPTTTTLNLEIEGTGTSTFAGGLEAWRQLAAPYFHATSSTATSTFAGGVEITGIGDGALTSYDLEVGDTDTSPSYGLIRTGNAVIGRTSYSSGSLDLDGAVLIRNVGGAVSGDISYVFAEQGSEAIRFAIPKSGTGLGTYNPRSFIIAGPATLNSNVVNCSTWGFWGLDCNTSGTGADLGVQDDLQVLGSFYLAESITASSTLTVATTTATSTLPQLDVTDLQLAGFVDIGSDQINEFAGTGLTVTGNALTADLGTSVDLTSEVTGTLSVANGGTGTTTLPVSQVLYGGSGGVYQSVATTSATIGSGLSYSGTFGALLGGVAGTLSLDTSGDWTGTFDGFEATHLQEFTYGTNIFAQTSLAPTTTTLNLEIEGTGTSTFAGGLEAWRQLAAPYFHATSTTATSTFSGGITTGTTGLNVLTNGRVGIGTESPAHLLQVGGGTTASVHANTGIYVNAGAFGQITVRGSSDTEIGFLAGTDSAVLGTFTDDHLQIRTNNFERVRITDIGFVGIGTTTPSNHLTVSTSTASTTASVNVLLLEHTYSDGAGGADIGAGLLFAAEDASDTSTTSARIFAALATTSTSSPASYLTFETKNTPGSLSEAARITSSGDFGIGTTTPWKRLSVTETVSDAQFSISYDTTRYANFQVDSAGDLVVDAQGGDVFLNDENLWVCTGGSCPSGTPSGNGNIVAETSVLVGTTTAQQELTVENDIYVANGFPSALGNATSTFLGDIKIGGKLDVGTIDPVYTIDGTKYATYGHSTIGIKEEVIVTETITTFNEAKGKYEMRIAFSELEEGSDLWLFYQITSFGDDRWDKLAISLTPGFDGSVFYEKHPEKNELMVYSSEEGEVSVRLIADRFDAESWPNLRPDQDDPFTHFKLELKK